MQTFITLLATLLLTLIIVSLLFYLFSTLKTPHYQMSKERMVRVLQQVLSGQANDNDWQMTFNLLIRHSEALESIRQRCLDIEDQWYIGTHKPPYLFSPEGLSELKLVLNDLLQIDD